MKQIKVLKKQHITALGQEPFAQVHASTLALCGDGSIAAAWFGGTEEKNPDVRIWFSKTEADGRWRRPVALSAENMCANWNPALLAQGNKLTLFYKEGLDTKVWRTFYRVSEDNGETWSDIKLLVGDDTFGRGPVKNKPIVLSNGDILAGASVEDDLKRWDLFVDVSSDNGVTWEMTDPIAFVRPYSAKVYASREELEPGAEGLIQPTLWEHPSHDGRVSLLARSSFGSVYRSDSADFGRTWSVARPTDLPNNNSGLDVTQTPDGTLALIYNPVGRNWGPRSPISVSLSTDNGETWGSTVNLETLPMEFSYPAIVCDGNKLYMTYTWGRRVIAYVEAEIVEE
ncbi:MAG: exo-alpha-sialidase [Clostridia bacterium]|nr:exo-alpha-sialidase [Clostridia bacterium]